MDRDAMTSLAETFQGVRSATVRLCATLSPEDTVVQSMPDTSPTKWHLAHITWFFERFVLEEFAPDYLRYDDDFHFLFNSYYFTVGQMHARPQRGLLSRPTYVEVIAYREYVDDAVRKLLDERDDQDVIERVLLGLNHEQQHQELLLTDIKHVLSCNPLSSAMSTDLGVPAMGSASEYSYSDGRSGVHSIGARGMGFCFDNETPRHDALLHPHQIGDRLVSNAEYREFLDDGSYNDSKLWLSDGWSVINERGWNRPLYWSEDLASEFTLGGMREIDEHAPVCHVVSMRQTRLRVGPAHVCRQSSSGKTLQRKQKQKQIEI